jgi:hypothetical protein
VRKIRHRCRKNPYFLDAAAALSRMIGIRAVICAGTAVIRKNLKPIALTPLPRAGIRDGVRPKSVSQRPDGLRAARDRWP